MSRNSAAVQSEKTVTARFTVSSYCLLALQRSAAGVIALLVCLFLSGDAAHSLSLPASDE